MSGKKAWGLSAFWILLALIFNGLIYYSSGSEAALQFFTAYLVEKSLSIDNLFVFLILFSRFKLSLEEQRKVLFWGVFGAIIFRLIFILLGIKVLMALHWMVYVLGAFLCFTGIKLLFRSGKKPDLERNVFLRFFEDRVKLPSFFLALLMIESADILFALDSIPAVLAITRDPFIAYTSNVFAILGLRALYFVVCPLLKKFTYLNWGLAAILVFVGAKMLLSGVLAIPLLVSLLVIVGILAATAICSWIKS